MRQALTDAQVQAGICLGLGDASSGCAGMPVCVILLFGAGLFRSSHSRIKEQRATFLTN